MVIPRTFIETAVTPTKRGWQAIVHTRPSSSIFTKARKHYFPTEEEAREFLKRIWQEQPHGRYSTQTVLRVADNLVLTAPYESIPKMLWHDGTLTLNGMTVAQNADSSASLKRAVSEHPLGDCLLALPCSHCGRLPSVRITEGTIQHKHADCKLAYRTSPDELLPLPVQVAVWNKYLRRRPRETKLLPLTRPHFMILGVLREPTEHDAIRKIRRYEVFSFDKP